MEAATLREEDKALISRIGGKMDDENMMQDYVDIVRQLRDLIREREEPLLTDPRIESRERNVDSKLNNSTPSRCPATRIDFNRACWRCA